MNRTRIAFTILTAFIVLTGAIAFADGPPIDVQLDAQERARIELIDDGFFDGNVNGTFAIGNRVRAGIRLNIAGKVGVYAQMQDVRFWGSEFHPLTGADGSLFDFGAGGFDMHQGFGEVRPVDGMVLRIGRQEINWHGQRLIGAVGWTHQGRSFDALRLNYDKKEAGIEFFYSLLLDRPNAIAALQRGEDVHLVAVRGGPRLGDALTLDGVAIARFDVGNNEQLVTAGVHGTGKVSLFRYEAEAYFQGGRRGTNAVTAYLIGVRAGVAPGDKNKGGEVGVGLDVVSGDADAADEQVHAFDTLYATNHKFYGHLDQYLVLPLNTGGFGLIDAMVSGSVHPIESLKIDLDVHGFFAAAAAPKRFHGVEVDLNASWKVLPGFSLTGGVWTYIAGPFWSPNPTPELGAYLQTDFNIAQK